MAFSDSDKFPLFDDLLMNIWHALDSKVFSTIVLIAVVFVTRSAVAAWLETNTDLAPHLVNRWQQRLRRITLSVILLLILVIWAPELRTFAVTLVAVAAAIVLAFKEVITCFTGTIIRATVEGASIGGRIIINNVHGDVAATDLMSTTILEVNDSGQRTGRTIVLPNSFFIGNATITEAAEDRKFILMMLPIPVRCDSDWHAVEGVLLHVGQQVSDAYIGEAKKHFARFSRRYGFNTPGPEPKVLIDWTDPDKITLTLRVAVPVNEQNTKRQEILRAVLMSKAEKIA